ncbi:hypothetical protein ACFZC6_08540 [Streptomyces ossamyceticus]|uniref:hypothetical protein n=1 Tax=Streptomyces ossamyceticus TaxID=249581 RepID=UPI0036E9A45A
MHATIRAHRARKARSPRWNDRRPLSASARSTSPAVDAARSRIARGFRYGERRTYPWTKATRWQGESAWRFGVYGRAVRPLPIDRSMLPREERMGRPQRR